MLNNSSKSMTSDRLVGLSLTGHGRLAPSYGLVSSKRQLAAMTDLRCEHLCSALVTKNQNFRSLYGIGSIIYVF